MFNSCWCVHFFWRSWKTWKMWQIYCIFLWLLTLKVHNVNASPQQLFGAQTFWVTEVADSHTAGIFIQDTASFHRESMNYEPQFIESQWKYSVCRTKMPAVWESATSLLWDSLLTCFGFEYVVLILTFWQWKLSANLKFLTALQSF